MDFATASVGFVGGVALTLVYRTVNVRWPGQYVMPRSSLDKFSMRGLFQYLFFRGFPPYVAACFVAATV